MESGNLESAPSTSAESDEPPIVPQQSPQQQEEHVVACAIPENKTPVEPQQSLQQQHEHVLLSCSIPENKTPVVSQQSLQQQQQHVVIACSIPENKTAVVPQQSLQQQHQHVVLSCSIPEKKTAVVSQQSLQQQHQHVVLSCSIPENKTAVVSQQSFQQQQQHVVIVCSKPENKTPVAPQHLPAKPESNICRKNIWGICEKLPSQCRFEHSRDPKFMKDILKFCHDFQNQGCTRPNCTYIHSTKDEQTAFLKNGEIPPFLVLRYGALEGRLKAKYGPNAFGPQPPMAIVEPTVQPLSHPVQPSLHPVQPLSHPVQPPLHPVQPPLHPVQPPLHHVQPMLRPVQPTLNSVQPTLNSVQPTLNPVQPTLNPVQSTLNPVQPSLNLVQPTLNPVQPTLNPVQSTLNLVQPTLNPVQTTLNPVHPTLNPVQPTLHAVQSMLIPRPPDIDIAQLIKPPPPPSSTPPPSPDPSIELQSRQLNNDVSSLSKPHYKLNVVTSLPLFDATRPPPPLPQNSSPQTVAVCVNSTELIPHKRRCLNPSMTVSSTTHTEIATSSAADVCMSCLEREISINNLIIKIDKLGNSKAEDNKHYQLLLENYEKTKKIVFAALSPEQRLLVDNYLETSSRNPAHSRWLPYSVKNTPNNAFICNLLEIIVSSNNSRSTSDISSLFESSTLMQNLSQLSRRPTQTNPLQDISQLLQQFIEHCGQTFLLNQITANVGNSSGIVNSRNNHIMDISTSPLHISNHTQQVPNHTHQISNHTQTSTPQPDSVANNNAELYAPRYDPNKPPPGVVYVPGPSTTSSGTISQGTSVHNAQMYQNIMSTHQVNVYGSNSPASSQPQPRQQSHTTEQFPLGTTFYNHYYQLGSTYKVMVLTP